MKNKIAILFLLMLSTLFCSAQMTIPTPYRLGGDVEYKFDISNKNITIYSDAEYFEAIKKTVKCLSTDIQFTVEAKNSKIERNKNYIEFFIKKTLKDEAYEIKASDDILKCYVSSTKGIQYAMQTLLQNLDDNVIKIQDIEDAPRFAWRGMMLDESRHFHGKEAVKNILDAMAYLKFNVFHWHLTDEDGWRIEIKRYPKLTEIGADGNWSNKNAPRKFYTQEEITEIIAYAGDRQIMVIPEIDMPGHATAISKAYPEISGGGEGRWEGFTFHPTKETTYEFIENVLDEIFELFPAPYIHLGGDEVHFGNQSWSSDPLILSFIDENNLKDKIGLEHYFIRRVASIVNSKGRKMIGWDEITESGVSPHQAIVMWWCHDKPEELTKALEKGFDVILTPRIPCYFDFVQDDVQKIGRRWGGDFAPLSAGYNFPDGLNDRLVGYEKQILGIQANVWSERIADVKRLYYMVFPRLTGISEAAWGMPENKDFDNFQLRLKPFLKWLDKKGINYFNPFDKESTPEPWGPTKHDVIAEG